MNLIHDEDEDELAQLWDEQPQEAQPQQLPYTRGDTSDDGPGEFATTRKRIRVIIRVSCKWAKASLDDYRKADQPKRYKWSKDNNGPPMNAAWASFVAHQDPDALRSLYMKYLRRSTKRVLDQRIISEESLKWLDRDCSQTQNPGTYANLVRNESMGAWAIYGGSGSSHHKRYGQTGVAGRTQGYDRLEKCCKITPLNELMAFKPISTSPRLRSIIKPGNRNDLCAFAEFEWDTSPRFICLWKPLRLSSLVPSIEVLVRMIMLLPQLGPSLKKLMTL